jgi:hypothetical protein
VRIKHSLALEVHVNAEAGERLTHANLGSKLTLAVDWQPEIGTLRSTHKSERSKSTY